MRIALLLACTLVLVGTIFTASADSFSDARSAFAEAESLYKEGKYAKAAKRYDSAYRMSKSPLILFNIAQSHRRQFQKDGNYDNLVESARLFAAFIDKANPTPNQQTVAEQNLGEVRKLSVDEAKRRFGLAESAMKQSKFLIAISEYDAAYQLSAQAGILYNIAQAQRRQFAIDSKLERLARAEALVKSYRRIAGAPENLKTIDELLLILKTQRTEFQRKREAEARRSEGGAMRSARELYTQGNGEQALAELRKSEKRKGKTREELIQIYRLRGQAAVLAGKAGEAAEAFKQYLALESAADGTGLSEESGSAFAEAKEYWAQRSPLKIDHLPPGKIAPKKRVDIPTRIASDPLRMITARQIRFRREGSAKWSSLAMRNDAESVRLPANPMPTKGKSYKVQYYITATDVNTNQLDTLGSSAAPLAFLVTKDAIIHPPPLYKRWWFWAAAGAVVAGGITTYAVIKSNELPGTMVGDVSE